MTRITVETPDPAAAGELAERLDPLAERSVHEEGDHFELQIELGATYDSHAEHGRALASLLLAIHGWMDSQQAAAVEMTIDGRRFTLHAPEREG